MPAGNEKNEIIFMAPILKECIWGGRKLIDEWGYSTPVVDEGENRYGECWGISAHSHGQTRVLLGKYAGRTLSDLWMNEHYLFEDCEGNKNLLLFGSMDVDKEKYNPKGDFPLLVKIIDAKDNLSIQVHPDDEYALINERSLGKKECWYILDCPPDAKLIAGNSAMNKAEFISKIRHGKFKEVIKYVPVKKGDFVQIDPGTLHAITAGITVLEVQQNSDVTYRVYDYDRVDKYGKPRRLHVSQAIEVSNAPDSFDENEVIHKEWQKDKLVELTSNDKYHVWMLSVEKHLNICDILPDKDNFYLVSIIEGSGIINEIDVKKGSHFILPYNSTNVDVYGEMKFIISCPSR